MKSVNESWSLFRLSDRKQFDGLPVVVVEYFHKLLSVERQREWMVWREPLTDWQPLGKFPEVVAGLHRPPTVIDPPPVPSDDASEQTHSVSIAVAEPVPAPKEISLSGTDQTVSLMLESKAASEDRDKVRYGKRFKIRIVLPDGSSFETVTVDASMSGLRFKDPIPKSLPRFFSVEVDCGPEGSILLMCSAVKESDGKAPHRVRIQVNDSQNKLRSALIRAA